MGFENIIVALLAGVAGGIAYNITKYYVNRWNNAEWFDI